ncbi:MAG: CidA/LrgA family protein, partial [Comamonas sp.]
MPLTTRATQAVWPLAKVVLQVGMLSAIWVAMEAVRQHFGWSLPAGLIGFGLLAVGLFTGLVKTQWLQAGTNWLMAEMLLFFVPAMLVVTEYP